MDRDIPVAERTRPNPKPMSSPSLAWVWIGLGVLGLAGGLVMLLPRVLGTPTLNASNASNPSPQPQASATIAPDQILGHLPYPEAPQAELRPITADGQIKLRQAAAREFRRMVADAQAAGVQLVPLSGFRSQRDQEHLFFEVKKERGQNPSERALVSAPPGYSEHHTGYAVDIGDATAAGTNLQTSFDQTPAFAWLQENAAYYSFELSFPEGNPQGISYEPWHWRYVGDPHSLKTFYQARQLAPTESQP